MEHLSPLGRHFTHQAEAFADHTLANPVQTVQDVDFEIYARKGFTEQAVINLPDGTLVDCFAKSASPESAARQVLVGQLATLLGAPTVPYILVRGQSGLERIKYGDDHQPGYTLISPRPFDDIIDLNNDKNPPLDAEGVPTWDYAAMKSDSLAAAGQFRAWLFDANFVAINMVQDGKSKQVCLIDPEQSDPSQKGIDAQSAAFIRSGWETRRSLDERMNYLDAAKLMARRIENVSPVQLRRLDEDNAEAGLPVAKGFIEGLIARRELFERPVVLTPLAERARFNMGPYIKPRMLKAG